MSDQPVQARINRAESNSSEAPLSIASSKSSATSRHTRFFSLGSLDDHTLAASSLKHKFFRSRSKSPAPGSSNTSNTRTFSDPLERSASPPSHIATPPRCASPTAMSRHDSSSPASASRSSAGKRFSGSSRKSSSDYKRYSGTLNHYGRHSNDWLFGGFSVRNTVREGIDRLLHHDGKEG
ncbi:hypothetical protein VTN96DRAFT_6829 [Rasamsonia emersonii]